jgi:hypothetical protein
MLNDRQAISCYLSTQIDLSDEKIGLKASCFIAKTTNHHS